MAVRVKFERIENQPELRSKFVEGESITVRTVFNCLVVDMAFFLLIKEEIDYRIEEDERNLRFLK